MNQIEKKFDCEVTPHEIVEECYRHYFYLVKQCRKKNLNKSDKKRW